MSRLHFYVRLFPNLRQFSERKLCISALVNSQVITNRSYRPLNVFNTYKWRSPAPFAETVRSYAKDKVKSKKGASRTPINNQDLSEVFDVEKLYAEFKLPVNHLKKIYIEELNLRTSANYIQEIKVRYDGKVYKVQDLAEINKKGVKHVVLDLGSFSDAIPSVLESLRNSALNVNPVQEGQAIIVPIPKITQEYRESSAKKAKAVFNKCKENIRNVQNKNIKFLNTKDKLSVDVIHRLKAQLTAIGDMHITEAEEIYKAKEKELLSTD